jgi:outer membrane biosynthesis protein TonB
LDERRSYSSFAGSAALHGAVLALLLLGFARAPRFADSPESIPIETVSLSQLNQIMNGEKDAKPAPPPAPTPPQPPADLRASAESTPPPQPAPTPPQPPKAETPPAQPAPPPPPKAEATTPPEPEPMPPQRPEPPSPPKVAVQDPSVQPPVRPKVVETPPERPKEPAPEKPKLPSHNFDPNTIAKLIGQSKPSTPATASTQTAAITPQGLPHHDAPHMSMSMASALDAWLTESYLNCWTPPPSTPDGDTYVAEIKVIFNPDGSLSGRPVLLNPPTDRAWRAHAESAMRAVRKCDPLKVPAEYMPYFEQWKVETIHFDPRETQG